ncbi:recombinase family protein [Streptomyces sp. NPDC056488]|uniref:recombinase family protein n=1 Tax=Streptomyces sp. NPDC056488 TaxID=3345836 RepID=UPI0036A1E556
MPEHVDSATGRRIIRCFLYARISEDREGAGLGVERQIDDGHTLAAQLSTSEVEYRIVRVFQDNDLSAYSGKPRPDYLAMLQALRDGEGDCVLAWHTDRLHRSPAELEEYIDVCEPRKVDTRTVKAGHLDLTTATGRMIARQLGVQARYEIERMIERQRRKREQMAERGEYFGGRRPFGYESDGITPRSLLCPRCGQTEADRFATVRLCLSCDAEGPFLGDRACRACGSRDGFTVECFCRDCSTRADIAPDSEAALVGVATDLLLAGASLNSIAVRWNEEGIPTSTGSTWAGPEVRAVVLRPRNAGILVHRGQEAGRGGWKALVDEPRWRSLAAFLTDDSRRTTPGSGRRHLGTGLYVCGVHGETMRVATGNTRNRTQTLPSYACRTSKHLMRRVDLLDDHVQLAVLERVSRPDAADLLAAREEPVDVRGAQRDMREARATLGDLAAALGRGEMDMMEWRVASGAAKQRLAAAERVLATAVKANPVVGLVGAEDPEAAWNALDLGRQRAVIDFLMTVVVLPARRGRMPGGKYWDPDAVRIDWK